MWHKLGRTRWKSEPLVDYESDSDDSYAGSLVADDSTIKSEAPFDDIDVKDKSPKIKFQY